MKSRPFLFSLQVESRAANSLVAAEDSVVREATKDLNILEQEIVKDVPRAVTYRRLEREDDTVAPLRRRQPRT